MSQTQKKIETLEKKIVSVKLDKEIMLKKRIANDLDYKVTSFYSSIAKKNLSENKTYGKQETNKNISQRSK